MSLNDTPRADRLHIGIFGRRNSGKSSLINRLTGQEIAIVSDTPGTTADPVYKSMELHPVGPVVFVDTAGYDDEGELGLLRVQKTREIIDSADIGIVVVDGTERREDGFAMEHEWIGALEDKGIPVILTVRNEKRNGWQSVSGSLWKWNFFFQFPASLKTAQSVPKTVFSW